MTTTCKSIVDVCGIVCGKLFPPDTSCNYRCALAQGSAAHACLNFPWPEPMAAPAGSSTATAAPAAASPAGSSPSSVYA